MPALSTVNWLLVFFLFALPLAFFPFTYLAFELPKVFLLYIFTVSASFLLLHSGYRPGNFRKIYILFLIFLAWIIITTVLGLSFGQSFLGSYFRWQGTITWLCYFVLFFISAKLLEDHNLKKYACLAILISSTVTASLAIIQFIFHWFGGNTTQLLYSGRVISTFGQPNFLGAYLVMSLPFIWYLLKQAKPSLKALIGFALFIILIGIFSTLSRSAYLGLVFLVLIWGIFHYRLLLAGIILSVVFLTLLANFFPNLVYSEWHRFKVDTFFASSKEPPTYNSNWTAENRFIIAQKTINLISQNPIYGYGLENFSLAFPSVITTKDLGLKDIVVDSSHNLFLDLVVQLGLVGLILFLTLISSTIITGIKRLKAVSLENRDFTKTAICAVFAFLIIHQFSPVSTVPAVLFWISLGIIQGVSVQHQMLSKLKKHIIIFSGTALIITLIFLIIQTIRADTLFRQANSYEVSDIHRAIKLDNDAIHLAPWIQFYQIRRDFLLEQLGY